MRIRTPSRIHIALIDLNGKLGRLDGGVGLALNEPYVELRAKKSDRVTVSGKCLNLDRFKSVAERMSEKFGYGIEIEVVSDYPSHVGLGSGTQISLGVCEAFNRIYGLRMSTREMAEIAGRGGTSGIGVAAFEMGGLIVDGGHSKSEKSNFLPSSASRASPAPVIARHDFPDWKVVVAVPDLIGFYGGREVNLFQEYCPIPIEEVRELSHIILMLLLPSVVEEDLDTFSKAIRRIQEIGFKKVETEQYGDLIKGCFDLAECVGMSSTGPAVYAVTDTGTKEIEKSLKDYFEERGFKCSCIITKARNRGAEVEF